MQLERRYRHLLSLYPDAFRREYEQELLAVLIAGARDGQQRPSLDEAVDLISNALLMRLWQMFARLFVRSYEVRHPRLLWAFRIVWGVVLLGLAGLELSFGSWWALVFLLAAVADVVLGYRIYQIARSQRG